ncbi:MAG: hypothetical protein Q8O91_11810, partial [Candidatus Aminicenantes bacterium]|nr:hypothetical protein [Candidatus Aminicenantes bacterium]
MDSRPIYRQRKAGVNETGKKRRTVKGRAFGSPLARGFYPRASTAEVDPRAKPGALTRDVNTRLSTAETDPQTKPALIRFANEDCKAWGPCRRPGRR